MGKVHRRLAERGTIFGSSACDAAFRPAAVHPTSLPRVAGVIGGRRRAVEGFFTAEIHDPETRRSMGKARVFMVALTVLMGVGLFACGGSDAPSRTMTVVGTEMAFAAPDSVVAGDYSVTFRNDGAVHHELAFRDPSGEIVARRSIPGGQSVVMEVRLEPGTWELGCFEPGHYEAGMHRQLIVEPPE
jgi:uncharacterized cupredoxin-like copper-binding protein